MSEEVEKVKSPNAGPGRPPKTPLQKDKEKGMEIKMDFGGCPYCAWENKDPKLGEVKSKCSDSLVEVANGRVQCGTCGKTWRKEALGQPYTLALERGPAWEREARARELTGGSLRS